MYKLVNAIFWLLLVFTVIYACSFVLIFLPDPAVAKFEEHIKILNWDLNNTASGDFDSDGKKDLITFTGCAFLSSVEVGKIPENLQCVSPDVVSVFYNGEYKNKIGQKYIPSLERNPDASSFGSASFTRHSYMGKENGKWKIFVRADDGFNSFEIRKGELLKSADLSPLDYVNESIYGLSVMGIAVLFYISFVNQVLYIPAIYLLGPFYLLPLPIFFVLIQTVIVIALFFIKKRLKTKRIKKEN